MKSTVILFIIALCIVCSEGIFWKFCSSNKDCHGGCCVKFGFFGKCKSYVKEGGLCGLSQALACGCEPGLDCEKVRGTITGLIRKCVDNSGSGSLY
ncbi:dickkopf-like protein Dlp-1 precursor [Hydra vulgaris]|uniref:Dickkopf-like protein Dlp-1 n=1 Tax=Hydra vulgaris TaxID=6087 RepID=Q3I3L7_HYDVU|nr:dickkopf-like protein Dlp-1 precursor [Hydra vulgaris]AAZ99727.1 dickkopf-like protein Dlp-1 precursor [Hydra vulgaris]